jgi:hypothetical protein
VTDAIKPEETLIVGQWILFRDRILGDPTEQRIGRLVENHLESLAHHPTSGYWRHLYRDPADGRLWERSHPRPEMQGGGPRALRVITPERALEVYGWSEGAAGATEAE